MGEMMEHARMETKMAENSSASLVNEWPDPEIPNLDTDLSDLPDVDEADGYTVNEGLWFEGQD